MLILSAGKAYAQSVPNDWCSRALRPELLKLKEIKTTRPWFKVYDMGHRVYAIDEPYNYEETIAYLIIGHKKALLFDTGMGMDSISLVVRQLTRLPVIVLNSHTHFDHIGGNHEFSRIMAMNTPYTRLHAQNGYSHTAVRSEVTPDAFCRERLPGLDTSNYRIQPFKVWKYINDGYKIALGDREIKVIATPGHAPDAISLWDARVRYLWTGDSFYLGPIFLFAEGTNLDDYAKSIGTIAHYAKKAAKVLPAHNLPMASPADVIAANKDFKWIVNEKQIEDLSLVINRAKTTNGSFSNDSTKSFDCGKFSFRIGLRYLDTIPRE